jgi:hypothetical protein
VQAGYCGVVAPLPPGLDYVLARDPEGRFTLRTEQAPR